MFRQILGFILLLGTMSLVPSPSWANPWTPNQCKRTALFLLPYDIKTASCETILEYQNHDCGAKHAAAYVYIKGTDIWGKKCVKKDYVKAFKMLEEIGNHQDIRAEMRDIRGRAKVGNSFHTRWLKKLERAGFGDY